MGELEQYASDARRIENEKRTRKKSKASLLVAILSLIVAAIGTIAFLLK